MKQQIEELLPEIKNICPAECDVTIVPAKYLKSRRLIIIRFPEQDINLDSWAAAQVYPLRKKVNAVLEEPKKFREIYCCGNKFVFYSPFILHVLKKFQGHLDYKTRSSHGWHQYIGECQNIDELITFLTEETLMY